uniref:Endonuclease/exonuclease/phosphatase domain-containing protein n=1 Tax=Fagus sylvatica TaxID=28930 RepID=A0A2N9J4N3_FAGSY
MLSGFGVDFVCPMVYRSHFIKLIAPQLPCPHTARLSPVVEYKDHSSGQTRVALAEAPNEALPLTCRPNFAAAWLTKHKFKGVNDGLEWVGTGLYGPTNDLLRRELWVELQSVYLVWNLPWVVFGDFNVVRFPSERLGCTRLTPPMVDSSDFIESSHLVDLPLGGGPYTWKVGSMTRGKSPFWFENMWLKDESFVDRVEAWWSSYSFSGPPNLVLARKLKALKGGS